MNADGRQHDRTSDRARLTASEEVSNDDSSPNELDVVRLKRPVRTKDQRDVEVALYADLPEIVLPAGEEGTVLAISKIPGKPTEYLVEFADTDGVTIAMPWLLHDDVDIISRQRAGRQ